MWKREKVGSFHVRFGYFHLQNTGIHGMIIVQQYGFEVHKNEKV